MGASGTILDGQQRHRADLACVDQQSRALPYFTEYGVPTLCIALPHMWRDHELTPATLSQLDSLARVPGRLTDLPSCSIDARPGTYPQHLTPCTTLHIRRNTTASGYFHSIYAGPLHNLKKLLCVAICRACSFSKDLVSVGCPC